MVEISIEHWHTYIIIVTNIEAFAASSGMRTSSHVLESAGNPGKVLSTKVVEKSWKTALFFEMSREVEMWEVEIREKL